MRPSEYYEEGVVLQVDPGSFYCKVRTLKGRVLPQVTWLSPNGGSNRGGDRSTPNVGDRPVISYTLGYPLIIGYLPRPQIPDSAVSQALHTGQPMPGVGNYGPSGLVRQDASRPTDLHLGDRVISSSGGAILGALRGGSLLLRSSRAAEILLSKVIGLVRIVSRNWEHFSDVSSDVIRNLKGRIYRYSGYSKVFGEAKNEDYRFHQYFGDVVVAEQIKTQYHNVTATLPVASPVIYKEQITDVAGAELMRRTIETSGNEEVVVKTTSEFTRMKATAPQLSFSYKDVNSLIMNNEKIHILDQHGSYMIMTDTSIHIFHHAGADVLMNDTGIKGTMGAGEVLVTDSSTRIKNGSHSVTVTASGVTIV